MGIPFVCREFCFFIIGVEGGSFVFLMIRESFGVSGLSQSVASGPILNIVLVARGGVGGDLEGALV